MFFTSCAFIFLCMKNTHPFAPKEKQRKTPNEMRCVFPICNDLGMCVCMGSVANEFHLKNTLHTFHAVQFYDHSMLISYALPLWTVCIHYTVCHFSILAHLMRDEKFDILVKFWRNNLKIEIALLSVQRTRYRLLNSFFFFFEYLMKSKMKQNKWEKMLNFE